MNCNSCKIKSICTINEIKQKHDENICISVNSCKYKELIDSSPEPKWTVENPIEDWLSSSYNEEEYQKALRKLNEDSTDDELNILVECKTCKGNDYQHLISVCSKCGKEVCGNCGTSDSGLLYCKECWEAL